MIMDQHLGVVMANDTDQEKRGGIKVRVDTLLADFEYPDLFYPIFPPNMFKVPEVGEVVEVIVIGDIDESQPNEDNQLGTVEFSDYCFWTGRVFDSVQGQVPKDLKKNYPKRAGLFWHKDGTIIFYDSTKNAKELYIALTDKKVYIQLKEDQIIFAKDQTKITLKDNSLVCENGTAIIDLNAGVVTITNATTKFGGAGAAQPILLGTIVVSAFTALFSAWQGAITTALTVPPAFVEPKLLAYLTTLQGAITAIQATLVNWSSVKHFADS